MLLSIWTFAWRVFIIGFYVGVILASLGFLTISPYAIQFFLAQFSKAHPVWPAYKLWHDLPVTITIPIYVYNVTNSRQFLDRKCKPTVQEVGPYVYKMKVFRENLSWDEDEGTVRYKISRRYAFSPELSEGLSDEDEVIVPNFAMFAAGSIGKQRTLIEQFGVSWFTALFESRVFVKVKVKNLVFHGYYDRMAELLQKLSGLNYAPGGMIGIMKRFNESDGMHEFVSDSGRLDRSKLGELKMWNESSTLPYWNSAECNTVRGSDGVVFPKTPIDTDRILEVFHPELCRPVKLKYKETVKIRGIRAFRFQVPFTEYASPQIVPENSCYCRKPERCYDSGFLDLGPCNFNAPALLSFPHFYRAEKHHLQRLNGVPLPLGEEFKFQWDVEPHTGATLGFHVDAQVNLNIIDTKRVGPLNNIPKMVLPVIWMQFIAEVGEGVTDIEFYAVFLPQMLSYLMAGLLIGAAILFTIFLYWKAKRTKSKEQMMAKQILEDINVARMRKTVV